MSTLVWYKLSHVIYKEVMSFMEESCHLCTSHVSYFSKTGEDFPADSPTTA